MLAKTGTSSQKQHERCARAGGVECTQVALDALLGAQAAATRRPPFRVTPAHVMVGIMRQPRSGAGELLTTSGLTEDRVWAAIDYRKWGFHGMRKLRDPILGSRPRWSRVARDVVAAAARECRRRDTSVVDTLDLLAAIGAVGDAFAEHLLTTARVEVANLSSVEREAHLVELERSPTTQLPSFTTLRKLHV
ncbi:MAG TPA: Clp protease N-terminal domain-containing protein [Acidimicrobiia bacterium]|jgi:ATP-dependent Clp protease ATP-binding subunit ClpA